ncbi:MAG: PAS domain S-box protein [Holophagales bacterium]|nr:PAS domain S-box protein [Holophagales bacterium]
MEIWARALPGADRRYVAFLRDVTARLRMEAELREGEERFRRVFEDAPIGVSLTAVDGSLSRVNRAFAEMLGYSPEELASVAWSEVTHLTTAPRAPSWSARSSPRTPRPPASRRGTSRGTGRSSGRSSTRPSCGTRKAARSTSSPRSTTSPTGRRPRSSCARRRSSTRASSRTRTPRSSSGIPTSGSHASTTRSSVSRGFGRRTPSAAGSTSSFRTPDGRRRWSW